MPPTAVLSWPSSRLAGCVVDVANHGCIQRVCPCRKARCGNSVGENAGADRGDLFRRDSVRSEESVLEERPKYGMNHEIVIRQACDSLPEPSRHAAIRPRHVKPVCGVVRTVPPAALAFQSVTVWCKRQIFRSLHVTRRFCAGCSQRRASGSSPPSSCRPWPTA